MGGFNAWSIPHSDEIMCKGRNGWFTPRHVSTYSLKMSRHGNARKVSIEVSSKQTYGQSPIKINLLERDAVRLIMAIADELGLDGIVLELEVDRELKQPGKADREDLST